jgi:hypothetical protein
MEAVAEQLEGIAGLGLPERVEEGIAVAVLGEHIGSVVTAIQCVIDPLNIDPVRQACHHPSLSSVVGWSQEE